MRFLKMLSTQVPSMSANFSSLTQIPSAQAIYLMDNAMGQEAKIDADFPRSAGGTVPALGPRISGGAGGPIRIIAPSTLVDGGTRLSDGGNRHILLYEKEVFQ